jgi:L-threonylcarbamoyladenylate synthase
LPTVSFNQLVQQIAQGDRLASFATDTLPALAANPKRAELIYRIKARSLEKPLILMAADIDQLWPYLGGTQGDRQAWKTLMETHWPGALTLVLPASDLLPPAMNPKADGTIGVRIPNHETARKLLRATGPLATTSVNRSGEPALTDKVAIAAQFPDLLLPEDFGPPGSGQASTVLNWNGAGWEILRQGSVII